MRLLAILVLALLAPTLTPTAVAEGPVVSVSMDAASHSTRAAADGDLPVATVSIVDGEGAGVAGVQVRVVFIRVVQFVGFTTSEEFTVTTGADGTASVSPTLQSALPGNYVVFAIALNQIAETRYSAAL